ncbi:ATP-binding protein [Nonomuraea sp. NPDC048882]|uniref:ATP-binding protein n=1 Tax=Nonomuraea sp. NPDC048882 TaxID=3154347 RepID=UPI0033E6DB45
MPKPTPGKGTEGEPDRPAARPHVQQIGTASGHGRVYQAGRDLTVHETVLPATALRPVTEVDAPPTTVNVPGHQQLFVGRDEELAALRTTLSAGRPAVVAAVHGLGGIGKSTLAARYATGQAGAFNPVWWITADTPPGCGRGWRPSPPRCSWSWPRPSPRRPSPSGSRPGWPPTRDGCWSWTTSPTPPTWRRCWPVR